MKNISKYYEKEISKMQDIKILSKKLLKDVEYYISFIEDNDLINDQIVLDTLDKLNEYSVKY